MQALKFGFHLPTGETICRLNFITLPVPINVVIAHSETAIDLSTTLPLVD